MKPPLHPCMNNAAHEKIARIHLPVALKCNIQCRFCSRKVSPFDEDTQCPGLASRILSPKEALHRAMVFLSEYGKQSIIGIAGPGDPLTNPETFETLELIRNASPNTALCLCTNGLLLPDTLHRLKKLHLHHLSLTVNAVCPDLARQITPWVVYRGRTIHGLRGAELLINKQLSGIAAAARAGIFVKVNAVVIPRINQQHITRIARTVKDAGAALFNPVPLIPGGSFSTHTPPVSEAMKQIRKDCEKTLPLFHTCKQCRADARGIPGQELCA